MTQRSTICKRFVFDCIYELYKPAKGSCCQTKHQKQNPLPVLHACWPRMDEKGV